MTFARALDKSAGRLGPGRDAPGVLKSENSIEDYRAENALLGRLLQDCQSQRQTLEKQLSRDRKRYHDAQQNAQSAQKQAQAAEKQLEQQQAEAERLRATLSAQSASLRRLKSRERDLEEMVLELKDEVEVAKAAARAAQQDAGEYKAAKAEAELAARRAESRAKAAARDLAEVRATCDQRVAAAQDDARATVERLQLQATNAIQTVELTTSTQVQELSARVAALQAQSDTLHECNRQLHANLQAASARPRSASPPALLEAGEAPVAGDGQQVERLRARIFALQQALAEKQIVAVQSLGASMPEEMEALAAERDELQRERDEAVSRIHEMAGGSAHAQQAALQGARQLEILRSDILRLSERLESVVCVNAELVCEQALLTDQVQAAEAAMAQMRAQLLDSQHARIELECTNLNELYRRVVGGSSEPLAADTDPGPSQPVDEAALVRGRVLQHAAEEYEAVVGRLKGKMHECADLEGKARRLLEESRQREAAAVARLAREASRVHTLEQMRLDDVRQLNGLQQQVTNLSQQLSNALSSSACGHQRTFIAGTSPRRPTPQLLPPPAPLPQPDDRARPCSPGANRQQLAVERAASDAAAESATPNTPAKSAEVIADPTADPATPLWPQSIRSAGEWRTGGASAVGPSRSRWQDLGQQQAGGGPRLDARKACSPLGLQGMRIPERPSPTRISDALAAVYRANRKGLGRGDAEGGVLGGHGALRLAGQSPSRSVGLGGRLGDL